MIRSYKQMQRTKIRALDGPIGTLRDIYFDDTSWRIQYLVIELGSWFTGKDVVIPPSVFSPYDGISLNVELTKLELKSCPDEKDILLKVSQDFRNQSFVNYFCSAGASLYGGPLIIPPMTKKFNHGAIINPHLHSCTDLLNYMIKGSDGNIGLLSDILIDDSVWKIRFVVGIIKSLSEKYEKLIENKLIDTIDNSNLLIKVSLDSKHIIKNPNFDTSKHVDRSYELIHEELSNI